MGYQKPVKENFYDSTIPAELKPSSLEKKLTSLSNQGKNFQDNVNNLIKELQKSQTNIHELAYVNLLWKIETQYRQIFNKLFSIQSIQKLKNALSESVSKNEKISKDEKEKVQKLIEQELDIKEVKKAIAEKLFFNSKSGQIITSEQKKFKRELKNSRLFRILNTSIISKTLNISNKSNLIYVDNQVRGILSSVSGRIKQIERNAKQLKGVQDRINSTSKNILDSYGSKTYQRQLEKYNIFVLNSFFHKLANMSDNDFDKLDENLSRVKMGNWINKRLKYPFHKFRENILKLSTKKFWDGVYKDIKRAPFKLIKFISGLGFNIAFGLSKLALKFGIKTGLFVLSLPFKMLTTGVGLIKNILSISINLVKGAFGIAQNFFKRISIFLMSPTGAYITGFIVGFIWQKLKQLKNYLFGKFDEFKDYINKVDNKLRFKYPQTYGVVRGKIDEYIEQANSWYENEVLKKFQDSDGKFSVNKVLDKFINNKSLISDIIQKFKSNSEDVIGKLLVELGNIGNGAMDFFDNLSMFFSVDNISQIIEGYDIMFGSTESLIKTTASAAIDVVSPVVFLAASAGLTSVLGPFGPIFAGFITPLITNGLKAWIDSIPLKDEEKQNKQFISRIEQITKNHEARKMGVKVSDLSIDGLLSEKKKDYDKIKDELNSLEYELKIERQKKEPNSELVKQIEDKIKTKKLDMERHEYQQIDQYLNDINHDESKASKERLNSLKNSDLLLNNSAEELIDFILAKNGSLLSLNDYQRIVSKNKENSKYTNKTTIDAEKVKESAVFNYLTQIIDAYNQGKLTKRGAIKLLDKELERIDNNNFANLKYRDVDLVYDNGNVVEKQSVLKTKDFTLRDILNGEHIKFVDDGKQFGHELQFGRNMEQIKESKLSESEFDISYLKTNSLYSKYIDSENNQVIREELENLINQNIKNGQIDNYDLYIIKSNLPNIVSYVKAIIATKFFNLYYSGKLNELKESAIKSHINGAYNNIQIEIKKNRPTDIEKNTDKGIKYRELFLKTQLKGLQLQLDSGKLSMEEFNRQRTELYNQSYKNKVDAKKIHHDMIQNEKDKLIEEKQSLQRDNDILKTLIDIQSVEFIQYINDNREHSISDKPKTQDQSS